jgi:hypothetical protein
MAKLTAREIWAIAKDEPLYRLAAAIVAIFVVAWLGSFLPEIRGAWRSIDRRPYPSMTAVYALGSDCVSFANLPAGWKPGRQRMDGSSVRLLGEVEGFAVEAWLVLRGKEPLKNAWAYQIGGQRAWDPVQVPGFTAWVGDESYIYADGDQANYRRSLTCYDRPQMIGRDKPMCEASDRGFPGKYDVLIDFPGEGNRRAHQIIDQTEAALLTVFRRCATKF